MTHGQLLHFADEQLHGDRRKLVNVALVIHGVEYGLALENHILLLGAFAFLQLFPAGIGDDAHALNEPRQARLDELFRGRISALAGFNAMLPFRRMERKIFSKDKIPDLCHHRQRDIRVL
jgi:hypothetical protein